VVNGFGPELKLSVFPKLFDDALGANDVCIGAVVNGFDPELTLNALELGLNTP
jgi:hypothetical protein